MFSPTTTQRQAKRITRKPAEPDVRESRRSLRDLVREAVDTAIEFATLGEATLSRPSQRPAPPALHREHPHRRHLDRHPRARRAGAVHGRALVCTTPARTAPARRH